MKILWIVILTLWSMTSYAESAPIAGQWLTEDKTTWVEISQSKLGQWHGVVTKSSLKPENEGQQILSSVVEAADGYKGKIYAIKKQKHFDADVTLMDDTLQITIKAGLFSKTMTWTRIK